MKKLFVLFLGALLMLNGSAVAQVSNEYLGVNDLSSNEYLVLYDFLPVVSGGTVEVQKPDSVKVEMDEKVDAKNEIVTADTAQDAVNAAVKENKSGEREIGCTCAKFGSGIGYVATGMGTYRNMKNQTATRLSKRQAYFRAFLMAKKTLAEYLDSLSVENIDTLKKALSSVSTLEDNAHNLAALATEDNTLIVDAVLRGFVIYNVEDIMDEQTVYVTIVSTPKTLGKLSRLSSGCIEAETIQEGLTQVSDEIKSGIVPPIGGRAIQVTSTGETAFVGFGSAVFESDKNKAIQARLNLSAKKIADARASVALCGLIIGDQVYWKGEVSSVQDGSNKGFNETDDPINENRAGNIKKLDEARDDFINRTKTTDSYASAQRGNLPLGVTKKTWIDSDGAWTYSMAVYLPSTSPQAAEDKEDMDSATIVQPIKNINSSANSQNASAGNRANASSNASHTTETPFAEQISADAVKWMRKAAELGDAEAQFMLGKCYSMGKGVDQNFEEAEKWTLKALEQGYGDGEFYENSDEKENSQTTTQDESKIDLSNTDSELRKEKYSPGEQKVLMVYGVRYALRWCPAGTFIMGSPETEEGHQRGEAQHEVKLSKGFWMLETEVTQNMWESVMGYHPYDMAPHTPESGDLDMMTLRGKQRICKGDNYPMTNVNWSLCKKFCLKLSRLTNETIKLPTEAQWEYACRAGTTGMYGISPEELKKASTYDDKYLPVCGFSPVGLSGVNSWGLYDMNANVWEWCEDWHSFEEHNNPMIDPTGPASGMFRVIRGGGNRNSRPQRSAYRILSGPDVGGDHVGFRFILIPQDY